MTICKTPQEPSKRVGLMLLIGFLPFLLVLAVALPFVTDPSIEKFVAASVVAVYLVLIFRVDSMVHWLRSWSPGRRTLVDDSNSNAPDDAQKRPPIN